MKRRLRGTAFDRSVSLRSESNLFSNMSEFDKHTLLNEADRLKTFDCWPYDYVVTKESLAAAGFYYLHIVDRVKCAYCDVVLADWKVGDDPMKDHTRYAPICPFVRAVRDVKGNISLVKNVKRRSNDECGITTMEIRPFSRAEEGKKNFFNYFFNKILSFIDTRWKLNSLMMKCFFLFLSRFLRGSYGWKTCSSTDSLHRYASL